MDFQANYANPDVGDYTNITNEYFFWTPDLPEISVKQAHTIMNWFNRPENCHMQFLARWPNHSVSQRTTYENLIKPLIYPDYDPLTFQVGKPGSNFYSEMDHWFYENFKDHALYRSWQAGIRFVEGQIDPKYFNKQFGRATGFVGFLSPFYKIGTAVAEAGVRYTMAENVFDRF
jgi:endo-1,4-beta-mannosidase